jgi:hypothetical protein
LIAAVATRTAVIAAMQTDITFRKALVSWQAHRSVFMRRTVIQETLLVPAMALSLTTG